MKQPFVKPAAWIGVLCCIAGIQAEGQAPRERLLTGFEDPADLPALSNSLEGATVQLAGAEGVTEGKRAIEFTGRKGQPWCSFLLPAAALAGWTHAEAVVVDVLLKDSQPLSLALDLSDKSSVNHATRSTLHAELKPGQQTVRFDIAHAARNAKESADWDTLDASEKVSLADLQRVKLFVTGNKDRDLVLVFDNLRLALKSDAQVAEEQRIAAESGQRKIVFKTDFDDNAGLGGEGIRFHGNWRPLDNEMKGALEAPLGEGNASKLALTVRTLKAGHNCCMELPSHGMEVEKYGWEGGIRLKIFNSGFESFQMTYSPIYPSDVTFYRARFDVPKGKWVEMDVPLDKFLYQGRRPRRNCQLEYICLIGVNPESDTASFQFDDFQVYRQKKADVPPPRAVPNPDGALYRQDFDNPMDFDMESYYPVSKRCNVYWTPGGVEAGGAGLAGTKDGTNGCLKLEMAESGEGRGGRRGFSLAPTNAVVEFDGLSHGFTSLLMGARSKVQLRASIPDKPVDDRWTHYVMPCWKLQDGNGAAADPADRIWELTFGGQNGKVGSYLLIDNITVREATAEERRGQ